MTVVAFAPNWLGDAVMALPALADLRRHFADDRLLVAARRSVASLFEIVPGIDGVVELGPGGGLAAAARVIGHDVRAIRGTGASTAVLFPNSLRSALTARLAGVPERWGYRRDVRRILLTRGVARAPGAVHQVDVYRHLVAALGIGNGDRAPALPLSDARRDEARAWLAEVGWDRRRPIVGFAPGAAYGGAKRWPPQRVARVMADLLAGRDVTCVVVGSAADAGTADTILAEAGRITGVPSDGRLINAAGRTSLTELAGILSVCHVFVSNDSGAMHLAAALGTPVVAVFGPTNEIATAPVARPGAPAVVLTGKAWCRPCGFRECPLDHRCMRSIPADWVLQIVSERL